jgi:NAD(P)-dependent dehydrogenase (short-subunit alcohol dehydrogenase family)
MKSNSYYLNKLFNFQKKIVLVTGSTGQLGKAICKSFIDLNAIVIGIDVNINSEMMLNHCNITYMTLDIQNKNSIGKIFKKIYDKYKTIDILINNAGVSVFTPFEKRNEESFNWTTSVNLKGTFLCIQEYAKNHKNTKHEGSIVNIASIYGIISPDPRIYQAGDNVNSEVYGATKAGIIQMTKYFAVHLADSKIRVNAVSPGGIYNPEKPQSKNFIAEYSKRNPMGRMANAEEILGAILYLASDASSYVTGHNLVVDGGMSCW